MQNIIRVNAEKFDPHAMTDWLAKSPEDGAIVTFIGKVRANQGVPVDLFLEHYPEMTEQVLEKIILRARARWPLNKVVIIHRIGEILANEAIVFVGVSSGHRDSAFAAAEFMMDVLKNEAPFWKKEKTAISEKWVAAKKNDVEALKKWN